MQWGKVNLKRKQKYIVENSNLIILVLNVAYSGDGDTMKVRLQLRNRHNGIFYEEKYYRLSKAAIAHWKVYVG